MPSACMRASRRHLASARIKAWHSSADIDLSWRAGKWDVLVRVAGDGADGGCVDTGSRWGCRGWGRGRTSCRGRTYIAVTVAILVVIPVQSSLYDLSLSRLQSLSSSLYDHSYHARARVHVHSPARPQRTVRIVRSTSLFRAHSLFSLSHLVSRSLSLRSSSGNYSCSSFTKPEG